MSYVTIQASTPAADVWGAALEGAIPIALEGVAEVLREFVDSRFEQQSDPWGAAWTPLSQATLAARARRLGRKSIGNFRILIDRGILRGSIAARVEGNKAIVFAGGAAAPYANAQNSGTARIPARPFMPIRDGAVDLPDALRDEIRSTILDAIKASLGRVFHGGNAAASAEVSETGRALAGVR